MCNKSIIFRIHTVISSRTFVTIGSKEIEYNSNFRLYFTTKLTNPNFLPHIFSKTLVIDFKITLNSLEEKLIGHLISYENFELEQRKNLILSEYKSNGKLLERNESDLLSSIISIEGSIIDCKALKPFVEQTKLQILETNNNTSTLEKHKASIETECNAYRLTAKKAANLYFVLYEMSSINWFYQHSLKTYMGIFENALKQSTDNSELTKRLENFIKILVENVYSYGCLGTFNRDKLMFSFQITIKLELCDGKLNQNEIDFFIRGGEYDVTEIQCPVNWLPKYCWKNILSLKNKFSYAFGDIVESLKLNHEKWKNWYFSEEINYIIVSNILSKSLSPFQVIIYQSYIKIKLLKWLCFCNINNYLGVIVLAMLSNRTYLTSYSSVYSTNIG